MAKRKRLTPAKIDTPDPAEAAPETKSLNPRYPLGVAPTRTYRPPIADVAQDASASAALTELAQTLTAARDEGRLIQRLPLDAIDDDHLVRDRMVVAEDEMTTLTDSLRARGQQTAIEVTDLGKGRYGLISGWRRLTALRQLSQEDAAIDTVLAIVRQPGDAAAAYLAMVEENEIRVGLTHYERARIVARAVDQGIYKRDRVALAKLFHAASRPKRSKVGSFVRIVRALDAHLRFPTALNERNGLALAQALEADAQVAPRVIAALQAAMPDTADAEVAVILKALRPDASTPSVISPAPQTLRKGLQYKETAKGDIVLSGAVVADPEFRVRLQLFLARLDTQ